MLLRGAKKRADKSGIAFGLLESDLEIPEKCPVLGIPLKISDGAASFGSPTVDRVDNSKGYIPDNIAVISYRANTLKSDATLEELRAIVRYMESKL